MKKLKIGLYWSEHHRMFYHYDGKTLEKCWTDRFLLQLDRHGAWSKSDYHLFEFKAFNPIWLGRF